MNLTSLAGVLQGPYGGEQEEEAGWLQRAGIVILQDEGLLDS